MAACDTFLSSCLQQRPSMHANPGNLRMKCFTEMADLIIFSKEMVAFKLEEGFLQKEID